MWLVAGLGNPGDDYEGTRHNSGFMAIDILSARLPAPIRQKTSNYIYGRGVIEDQKVMLLKPLTFMNRSGIAVWEALRRYDEIDNLIVIHDDIDLDTGVVRIRKSGSSGGHNGIKSIIDSLGSHDFIRVKIGIGRPRRGTAERYVLKLFNKEERPVIEKALETAADAVDVIIRRGVSHAQNIFHREDCSDEP